MKLINKFPRRSRMDLWTKAEKSIHKAVQEVECAGAHPFLTDAVVLLQQARDKVADFVELEIPKRPTVVCLCGSTRFVDYFLSWQKSFTYQGKIVLSIEITKRQDKTDDPQHVMLERKKMLDGLHLRKIDMCDEVFVINVGGYIGESTAKEIEYAKKTGKPIKYMEHPPNCIQCSN